MKPLTLVLSSIALAVLPSVQAHAAHLKCNAVKDGWSPEPPAHFGSETVSIDDVQTVVPSNSAPGTLEARPVFSFSGGYELRAIIRIGTQHDDSLWYRYNVYKIEGGRRRGLGNGMVGEVSATDSKTNIACIWSESTTCLAASTGNVDVDTILGNLDREISPAQGYAEGILPKDMPSSFGISCNWYK